MSHAYMQTHVPTYKYMIIIVMIKHICMYIYTHIYIQYADVLFSNALDLWKAVVLYTVLCRESEFTIKNIQFLRPDWET